MKRVLIILLALLLFSSSLLGALNGRRSVAGLQKTLTLEDLWFDVNRQNGVLRNNGIWYYNVLNSNAGGLEWPIGSGNSPIFGAGQWISAQVDGEVRVAGVIHDATEFQPGVILPSGEAANRRDAAYRWYTLEPGGVGDWDSWPVDQGAPVDANGDPLLIGDRTSFCVWNDLGEHSLFSTNKLGAEVRQTIFGFNRADALGDMVFIKWQIVNKSGNNWESTYLSIWSDPDVGDGWDDFVGSDPELGLGYCYNADNDDQNYGAAPPAVGIDFFQGPIIDEVGSTVTLPDGTVLQDKKMLKMTAFIFYNNNDSNFGNPQTSGDVWNYQRGYWRDNSLITDPDGNATAFMFTGDPESDTGWLDSNTDDRRFLMTTGPFTMPAWDDLDGDGQAEFGEPGVQEIVAGVIVAKGINNLNSVTKLKEVDELAQMAYDLDFNLAKAPNPAQVTVSELANELVINWDNHSEFNGTDPNRISNPYEAIDPVVANAIGDTVIIDNIVKVVNDASYNFYGYSVYQYTDASGADPVEIAHWDNGGVSDAQPYVDPRYVRLTTNRHIDVGTVGDPLVNGKEYYYGVVAHGYLEFGAPVIFNSPATIVTAMPRITPGEVTQSTFSDTLAGVEHTVTDEAAPLADADVIVRVVDPTQVTGHDYQVFFNQQHSYLAADGTWKFTGSPDAITKMGKSMDLTGTAISGISYVAGDGVRDLAFTLDLVAPDGNWSDGMQLTFPPEIEINSAADAIGNGGGHAVHPVIDYQANTVTWGSMDTTNFGEFAGGEVFVVNVQEPALPLDVDYFVYDDGWATLYYDDATIVHIEGTTTITEETNYFKTEQHWNLKNVTTDEIVLEDRLELFGPDGEGLSGPVVDGLQVIVYGSYAAPYDFSPATDPPIEPVDNAGNYDIDSYGANGWSEFGNPNSARAFDAFSAANYGVTDLNILVQDYELRFTGEYDDPVTIINGADTTIWHPIREGTGSIATLYGSRNWDVVDHPMNPNPGVDEFFALRVPFEVWNVTTGKQVNFMIYDRIQLLADSNTVDLYAFNPNSRMYCYFLNSDYTETAQDHESDAMNDLTWNVVFWEAGWTTGDVIHFNYANPIQLGIDEFAFSTAGAEAENTATTQKADIDKINVVPNPYYGYHNGEMDAYSRWVQFTYLPETCTVRIFDLAGQLVRILDKDSPDDPFLRWDLKNEYDLPVASGVYVYHVEIPGMGEKIGKLAIFAPNERLDTY